MKAIGCWTRASSETYAPFYGRPSATAPTGLSLYSATSRGTEIADDKLADVIKVTVGAGGDTLTANRHTYTNLQREREREKERERERERRYAHRKQQRETVGARHRTVRAMQAKIMSAFQEPK